MRVQCPVDLGAGERGVEALYAISKKGKVKAGRHNQMTNDDAADGRMTIFGSRNNISGTERAALKEKN